LDKRIASVRKSIGERNCPETANDELKHCRKF
jgi:hypothetical protein